jgi:hypothetical protein
LQGQQLTEGIRALVHGLTHQDSPLNDLGRCMNPADSDSGGKNFGEGAKVDDAFARGKMGSGLEI